MAKIKNSYLEKLKDPRWQKKRLAVLDKAGWKCSLCGDMEKTLHVHHWGYKKGLEPWEYNTNDLACLCEDCHENESFIDKKLDETLYEFKTTGLLSGNDKTYLIGVIQAIMSGYTPYHDEVILFSENQCRGIADYMGYKASKEYLENGLEAYDIMFNPAYQNEDKGLGLSCVRSFLQMDWYFKIEEKSQFIIEMAKQSPVLLREVINSNDHSNSFWGYQYWPDSLKQKVLKILSDNEEI
jgi:hypothetical protein